MPTISLITAVLDGYHEHLPETYESLRTQSLPAGWDWQWIVQEDGETGRPLQVLPTDRRIAANTGPRGRAATARTMALTHANGIIARALDGDDLLTDGALARDIETLADYPEIGWCVSPTVELQPDGTEHPSDPLADPGPLPMGYFLDSADRLNLPLIAGGTMCAYTDLIRALGGWPAVPANDDVGLLLAVEAVSDGWMIDKPSLMYRRWPGSTTDVLDAARASAVRERRAAMLDRAESLRRAGWRWSPERQSGQWRSN